jgi:hypothetical protein
MAIPSTINIKRTTLATETQYHTHEQNIANHQTEIDHYGRSVLIMLCATVLYTQPAQEEERKEKKRKEKEPELKTHPHSLANPPQPASPQHTPPQSDQRACLQRKSTPSDRRGAPVQARL